MHTNRNRILSIELGRIAEALVTSGYTSLDQQAQALGIHRNTAWTIVNNKHKLGRLSAKTIDRILSNLETPPTVRAIVQQ
jgi:plasmid maintenance system antidote protein VapI